jgi:hypothetical protein
MMDGPTSPTDFPNLEEPDQSEDGGTDKAGPQHNPIVFHGSEPCPAQEKELNQFIQSVLNKTSKLHVLVGELQSKYDDTRAAKFLGPKIQLVIAHVVSIYDIYVSIPCCAFPAGPKK